MTIDMKEFERLSDRATERLSDYDETRILEMRTGLGHRCRRSGELD
jgi:hypothetical protein